MRNFARLISIIFHPVTLFAIMPFLVVYKQTHRPFYALAWDIYSSAFIITGIVAIQALVWAGMLSDRDVSRREERKWMYAILCSLAGLYMIISLIIKGHFFPLSIISFGIVAGILLFTVINHFTKLSVHNAVGAAFVVSTYYLFGPKVLFVTIWILPLLFWARIKLHRHTFLQIVAGYIFGIAVTIGTLALGKFIYSGM